MRYDKYSMYQEQNFGRIRAGLCVFIRNDGVLVTDKRQKIHYDGSRYI